MRNRHRHAIDATPNAPQDFDFHTGPEKFQLDSSGAKAAWRRQLVERLRELVARERGDRVNAGWDGATGQRRTQQLPPLPAKQRRHPAYYYPFMPV